jgi:hypothetical protein
MMLILETVVAAVISVVVTLLMIHLDTRRWDRSIVEKERLVDDQIAACSRLLKSMEEERTEIQKQAKILGQLIKAAKPIGEHLDDTY